MTCNKFHGSYVVAIATESAKWTMGARGQLPTATAVRSVAYRLGAIRTATAYPERPPRHIGHSEPSRAGELPLYRAHGPIHGTQVYFRSCTSGSCAPVRRYGKTMKSKGAKPS